MLIPYTKTRQQTEITLRMGSLLTKIPHQVGLIGNFHRSRFFPHVHTNKGDIKSEKNIILQRRLTTSLRITNEIGGEKDY